MQMLRTLQAPMQQYIYLAKEIKLKVCLLASTSAHVFYSRESKAPNLLGLPSSHLSVQLSMALFFGGKNQLSNVHQPHMGRL
jgi:hypothetical protein